MDVLRERMTDLFKLLFNDPKPYERLEIIAGYSASYWQEKHKHPNRKALNILIDCLRAHLRGLRDHITDCEQLVVDLVPFVEAADLWKYQTRSRRRASALRAAQVLRVPDK